MALTTLILGAGLGREYGFPDGKELRDLIVNELPDHDRELRDIFDWSPGETVDEIAAQHPKHAKQVKDITIKILYERENKASLQQNTKPNTYKLILKQIAEAKAKGDEVKIITFNYDRSLQYLLHRINTIQPPERKIEPTIIVPIFGRLAPLFFEDSISNRRRMNYHDYGQELESGSEPLSSGPFDDDEDNSRHNELVRNSKISFIGEKSSNQTSDTKETLESSDQIFFLGVGYHKPNMATLGFDFKKRHPGKIVAGTGLGLDKNTIEFLKKEYPAIAHIETCDAHTFLKSKFDISNPSENLLKRSASSFDAL